MATEKNTLARPYAKAVFEYALEEKTFATWSDFLAASAQVTADPRVADLLNNPLVSKEDLINFYKSICQSVMTDKQENFLRLLAANERLSVLPEIAALYEALRSEEEKTINVEVASFLPLTNEQQDKLIKALSARLNRQVQLNVKEDKSLLGGAIVQAGDLVIDGSARGKLARLKQAVVA